jgi:uncharacterized membrane protein YphA (DoxX/SURF4 family)
MSATAAVIVLAGRVLFAYFFGAVAGVGHFRRSKIMEGYAKSAGFPVPAIAGWPVGVWLIAGAVSLALGIWPDLGVLMFALFLIPAATFFHAFWKIEDPAQKQTQTQFFWRNMIGLGACAMIFGTFVTLGPALRFTITAPLFKF